VLHRQFLWPLPNQAWVGDITFLWTREGWVCLAILVDRCTRAIVGWGTSRHCDAALAYRCLEVTVSNHSPGRGMIVLHDQGGTYTAGEYQDGIAKIGEFPNTSRKGNGWDNGVAQLTFATIKIELFANSTLDGKDEVDRELFNHIESFYSRIRLHSTLGYITPAERAILPLQE